MRGRWETKTLGEACCFIDYRGKTPQKTEHGLRLITAKNVKMGFLQEEPREFVSEADYAAWMTRGIPRQGDVLFTTEAPLANVAQLDTDDRVVFAQRIIILQPSDRSLDPTFLKYQLLSDAAQRRIHEMGTGATVKGIKASLLREVPIALPPLPEQHRIVAILDEAFEGIATARANAEKNLANAKAIFESHLEAVFTKRGEGWVETTLGQEIDLLAGFAFKSPEYTEEEKDVRLLRGDNIVQGSLRWDAVKRWPANGVNEYRQYQLAVGDVVLAMDRPWVKSGLKHAMIGPADLPCLLVQRVARLRGKAGLDNAFLAYLIRSASFASHILDAQTGIGVPHISGQQIKDFAFAMPPREEQLAIVRTLAILKADTQRLTSIYERKISALDELKKSLLHQAFNGEL